MNIAALLEFKFVFIDGTLHNRYANWENIGSVGSRPLSTDNYGVLLLVPISCILKWTLTIPIFRSYIPIKMQLKYFF